MDEQLERVARAGDRQAFAEIYAYFGPRVKGFLMRGGMSPQEAEDLAQDVMVKVLRKAKLFDPAKAAAATWVFTIARNARIDAARRAARRSPEEGDPTVTPEESPRADALCELKERDQRIRRALEILPPEQREVMQLHFYEDASHSAIAARLGHPLGTIKSRLRLAFEKIRKELDDII